MSLSLVPITIAAAPLLAAMHKICFADPWNEKAMVDLLSMPGAYGQLARGSQGSSPDIPVGPEGFPQGFILCRAAGGEAEVLTLLVLPSFRRKGVAAALLARAATAGRQAGAEAFFLEVAADNDAGRALYSSQGFLEVGRRPRYYGGAVDALVMRLDLGASESGRSDFPQV